MTPDTDATAAGADTAPDRGDAPMAAPQRGTREDIVRVSFELFGRHGFDGVSIDRIARAASLSKGALYWYFRNKEDLFLECLKRLRKLLIAHIYSPMATSEDPRTQMQRYFQGIRSVLLDLDNLESISGLMIGLERVDRPAVVGFRRETLAEAESFVTDILRRGVELGQFRFPDAPEDIASALFVMVEGCLVQTRRTNIERSLHALESLSTGFFLPYGADRDASPR